MQDREGAIWIATGFGGSGGANKIENGQWSMLTEKDGLAGEKVRSLFEDREGNMWFGSEYDGVAVHSREGWKVLTPEEGLAGWEVLEIIQDSDGALWIATEDGISRIESLGFALAVGTK
jgi:ligand-binding sensor domain-containing protein